MPVRADGVELLGELPGSGYRQPPALVRRADGQTIQLTRLLHHVLSAVDGRRDYAEIAAEVGRRLDRMVSADDVRLLVESRLRPLGLLLLADGSAPPLKKSNPLLGLRFKFVVSNPERTRRITAPFAALFRPAVVVPMLVAFLAVTGWVLFSKGLASATYQAFEQPSLLLVVVAVTVLSAGFHEFGHAAACRYGGATPGAMGAGIYLVWPAFYTEVSDSYRLGRAGRLRVDLGGLYFNAIFAVATFAVWAVTGWDAVLLIVATQVAQMVRQLAPFVRFDGYHILADLTGVPDLYSRIKPTLLGLLPHRWRHPETTVLKPWARAVVTLWVIVVVPVLLFSIGLLVLALPRVVATAWQSLERHGHALSVNFDAGDFTRVAVGLVGMVAIALPVLAAVYLITRVVRQVTAKTWAATEGRPGWRAVACAAMAAVIALVAWAWWPEPDRYRPIQPEDRGTVLDALATTYQAPGRPQEPTGLRQGQSGTVSPSVWAATTPPPAKKEPKLALVLVPRDDPATPGTRRPGWVFPFNPPEAPGEGDNQALAVNTVDGATVYDVAFALVWAEDGEVANRNEAWALASCRDCRTVAVGFQVVLIVGQANVVVPENISAAVNYQCVRCVTYALAQQLVLTLRGPLSEETTAKLNALWAEIQRFAANLRNVPVSQIQAQLERYQARMLALLRADLALPTRGPTATPSPSGSASPGGSPTPSGTASAGASPSADGTPGETGAPGTPGATGAPGTPAGTATPTTGPGTAAPAPSGSSGTPNPQPAPSPNGTDGSAAPSAEADAGG
ncbi:MAG TPA: hypothetical protein VNV66_03810 [Pilimelia sp.]|nr:hypothetical protein [Pilimelia sp.]